ncbi:MAG TPA: DUF2239 family protein [Bryobacteraceae bacterium]|jgi:hypothetical protein|nr:DUF2239 family protein [Bryobacteraceae bacterium]
MTCTAFVGSKRIAAGELPQVASIAKAALDRDKWAQVLIFDDVTSELIEVDYRSTPTVTPPAAEVEVPRRPGRPKLGVVAREVTLLPRHWDWLASQPGGASVALRKLVEQARTAYQGRDRRRRAQESAYRFMSAMAGNAPDFEEAIRALFAGDRERFNQMVQAWPPDVRDHAKTLAVAAFLSD